MGKSFKKHSGVRAALHRELVTTGHLSREQGKLYDRLFADRHQGDYLPLVSFDVDYVGKMLKEGSALVDSLECLCRDS